MRYVNDARVLAYILIIKNAYEIDISLIQRVSKTRVTYIDYVDLRCMQLTATVDISKVQVNVSHQIWLKIHL